MLWPPLCLLALALAPTADCENLSRIRRRPCGRADKKKFNENLLNLFRAEYGKELASGIDVRKILNWKFKSLDSNEDDFLQRPEYKPLKRLKRLVKPKKCAKTFTRSCDRDRDSKISKGEWSRCLGVDMMVSLSSSMVSLSEDRKRKEEPEANDCASDRQAVLAEQRSHELYVPECGPDGRYRKVQCYKSTGYCWCVHEDDGKPIPGTSVKDEPPDCDSLPAPNRPMKGCPIDQKEQFLEELSSFLAQNHSTGPISSLTFSTFDLNGSKYLERKEWKAFRTMVASHKTLRRCGKRLPRFCDVNNDRRISFTEWSNCLENGLSGEQKRRGPNPLETILKND